MSEVAKLAFADGQIHGGQGCRVAAGAYQPTPLKRQDTTKQPNQDKSWARMSLHMPACCPSPAAHASASSSAIVKGASERSPIGRSCLAKWQRVRQLRHAKRRWETGPKLQEGQELLEPHEFASGSCTRNLQPPPGTLPAFQQQALKQMIRVQDSSATAVNRTRQSNGQLMPGLAGNMQPGHAQKVFRKPVVFRGSSTIG